MLHFKRMFVSMSLVVIGLSALTLLLTNAPTARANPGTIYVDASAPGPVHDGSSWAAAYITLQSALDATVYGDELWVADGVYTPTKGITSTATFALEPGVALYGGFGGYGVSETLRTQRDWTIYKSILSGDLDGNDINTDGNHIDETWNDIQGENAFYVVTGGGVTETTVLDGFTITAGNGTADDDGGGMKNYGSPTLTNVTFSGNHGGGLYNYQSSPTLTNVIFIVNLSDSNGGGMLNIENCNPTLFNVTFSGNRAGNGYGGGGMFNYMSRPTLVSVTFSGNDGNGMYNVMGGNPTLISVTFSGNIGGGMSNIFTSTPTLTNVTFNDNAGRGMYNWLSNPTLANVIFSGNSGGGMNNNGSSPSLTNVTFISNTATDGGGMNNGDGSSPVLTNVAFISNTATNKGGGMSNDGGSHPMLTDVTFSGNQSTVNGGGMWNGDSHPTLTNVVFSDNRTAWNGGGLFNWSSAPTLTNVIFNNNQATISGGGLGNFNNSSPELTNVTFSRNTATDNGGGMANDSSAPTLTNITFISNTATSGGGMQNDNGSTPTLASVTFNSNAASNSGGGMVNNSSNPTLINVTFSGNRTTDAGSSGGGMSNNDSNPTLTYVTFSDNRTAGWGGGGMGNDNSNPTLTHVTFSGNRTAGCCGGGMVNIGNSNSRLTNVTFSGNSATNYGGGLLNSESNPTLTNVLFSGNTVTDVSSYGGGMSNHNGGHPTLINATFSGNQAGGSGGGMGNIGGTLTLVNSIVWGNAAITGSQIYNDGSSASIVTYSDVQGGYSGAGNLNVDPNFVAPIAATAAPTTTGNYHLQAASYAIDAGNNLSVTVATDLDGQPRIIDGSVDMGAYEAAARFPQIALNPPTLAMTLTTNDAGLRYLTISDVGLGRLTWSLAETPPVGWLSAPLTGTATMSTSKDVAINFNAAGLPVGTYTTTLRVSSNDSGQAQIDVPVTLIVNTLCDPVAAIDLTRVPVDDVFAGDTVRFTASATGTVPFTHTWTVNTAPVGGNFSTLDRVFSATGTYTVGVTIANVCGQQTASLPVTVQTRSINQPDLSLSYKTVNLANVESGDTVTYTLVLRNQSAITATARITDPIPAHTTYVVGSAQASNGQPVIFGSGQLTWSGKVISGTPVIIEYAVTMQSAPIGTAIVNTAQLDDGLGHLTVLEARSTYNPGFSLSIDDGALYTNVPTVSLTLTWDATLGIDGMKISNDGGFGAGGSTTVWLPITTTYAGWVIPALGNQRLPYSVYVKFRDANGTQFGPIQDDIIYDPIVPATPTIQIIVPSTVRYGTAPNTNSVIVRVAATDDNSGVGTIQLSHTPDFAQISEYAATGPTTDVTWSLQSSGQVYVRVVDRAGNISAEKTAAKYVVYLPLVKR
jgi:uncharacterized repeat protein (TIGR01451 family)